MLGRPARVLHTQPASHPPEHHGLFHFRVAVALLAAALCAAGGGGWARRVACGVAGVGPGGQGAGRQRQGAQGGTSHPGRRGGERGSTARTRGGRRPAAGGAPAAPRLVVLRWRGHLRGRAGGGGAGAAFSLGAGCSLPRTQPSRRAHHARHVPRRPHTPCGPPAKERQRSRPTVAPAHPSLPPLSPSTRPLHRCILPRPPPSSLPPSLPWLHLPPPAHLHQLAVRLALYEAVHVAVVDVVPHTLRGGGMGWCVCVCVCGGGAQGREALAPGVRFVREGFREGPTHMPCLHPIPHSHTRTLPPCTPHLCLQLQSVPVPAGLPVARGVGAAVPPAPHVPADEADPQVCGRGSSRGGRRGCGGGGDGERGHVTLTPPPPPPPPHTHSTRHNATIPCPPAEVLQTAQWLVVALECWQ